ncbi:DUF1365 domain-containing protein [Aliidiomarina sp. Khilg15.8]
MDSAIYYGSVRHRRFTPTRHDFSYRIMQWWLALDELEQVSSLSRWLSTSGRRAPLHFRASDYLRGHWGEANTLEEAVRAKMSELHGSELKGRVFFLGNLRCWGVFFSPLNCYFLQQEDGSYSHMLAEVSNTPWLERHYYLVDLAEQANTPKAFHVSPFNPMDMQYEWRIRPTAERHLVHIAAHRDTLEFDATMALSARPMNRQQIARVLKTHPAMSFKIIAGIYWQAMKLLIKRVPFYGHPKKAK